MGNIPLKDYEGFLKLEKGLSPNSIDAYLTDMEKLMQFLEMQELEAGPHELDHEQLASVSWSGSVSWELSARSQARILSGLKPFIAICCWRT